MWSRFSVLTCVCFVLSIYTSFATAQSTAPADKAPKPQFFAGVVSRLDNKIISVSRTLVGRSPENRAFTINAATKMPKGGLKPRTRVTVRYEHEAEGDLALEIQIRPAVRVAKTP